MRSRDPDESARVERAMRAVPRVDFLPDSVKGRAEIDAPLPIGQEQTNSQPSTVKFMLELLDPQPGHRVLDVGAGSGWTTALLAHLVEADGQVIGIERQKRLITSARRAIAKHADERARIVPARKGVLGLPEEAPFDRILVSAEARRMPESLIDQLAEGGIMVVPVNGVMCKVVREGDEARLSQHGLFRFVPLIE